MPVFLAVTAAYTYHPEVKYLKPHWSDEPSRIDIFSHKNDCLQSSLSPVVFSFPEILGRGSQF